MKYQKKIKYLTITDEPDPNKEEKFGDKFIFFVYFLMFKHNFAFYIYIKIFIIQKYDIKLSKLPVIFFKIVQKNRLDYEYLTSYYHNCVNN